MYVKEQMNHSSIQVTVVTCCTLPGANVSFVDMLDGSTPKAKRRTLPQPAATLAQPEALARGAVSTMTPVEMQDLKALEIGGGGRTRTSDLRIMRPSL